MKDQIKVRVATVSNGYTLDLTIDGQKQGYMYFNVEELLEGFMYHVGLLEVSPYGKAEIREFLDVASKWQDNGLLVKELLQKTKEITFLKEHETLLEEQLSQKRNSIGRTTISKAPAERKVKTEEKRTRGKTRQTQERREATKNNPSLMVKNKAIN